MNRPFSVAHLTALDEPPPRFIHLAAEAGFAAVGLRLIGIGPNGVAYPLMDDAPLMRETQRAIKDTCVSVSDIEFIRIFRDTDIAALEPFVAAGAMLGAKQIIAAPYDDDHARLADRLGALAMMAARYRLGVVLEFFPWTSVPDLDTAWKVVEAAGQDNLGILVDALHFARSHSSWATLAAIPPERLPFVHLCDAPAMDKSDSDSLIFTAREARLMPGEGVLPLKDVLKALPQAALAFEVPHLERLRALGAGAFLKQLKEAADRLF